MVGEDGSEVIPDRRAGRLATVEPDHRAVVAEERRERVGVAVVPGVQQPGVQIPDLAIGHGAH
jgi:hypothetical protein